MKHSAIAALCIALAAFGAQAQMSVVKEAKKSFKPGGDYNQFVEIITPAFSNPETANIAETWYVAGKAGFDNYDYYLNLFRLGKEINESAMGTSLVKGFGFYNKALPLDSLPDAKGKVKPKYSKGIISDVAGHFEDFNIAAAELWQAKDYAGAYDAWTIYTKLPSDPRFNIKAPHDSVMAMINYNRGLAAWQAEQYGKALDAFDDAIALNYDDPVIFDYAAAIAVQEGQTDRSLGYARAGYEKSGSINNLRVLVNSYIDKEDYATARDLLKQAMEKTTDPKALSQVYLLNGIVTENIDPQASLGSVIDNYKKAMELDPEYGATYYNYGRVLFNKANALDEAQGGEMTDANYRKFRTDTFDPMLREAASNIEKSIDLDDSLRSNGVALLEQIYYQLNDNANLERIKAL